MPNNGGEMTQISGQTSGGEPPLLSLVIPTRNEAITAPELILQLADVLAPLSSEVIIVDDSDDDTPSIIERAARDNDLHVRVIHREPGRREGGLSTAVIEGLSAATGRYVLVMDADLQHPTDMVPTLVDRAEQHDADIVIASRYVSGGSDAGLAGPLRKVLSAAARWLVTILFFDKLRAIHDPLSGFFLVRTEIIDPSSLRPIGFKILLDILVRCRYRRVDEAPLRFEARSGGSSKANLSQGRDFLVHTAALVWDVRLAGLRRLVNRSRR